MSAPTLILFAPFAIGLARIPLHSELRSDLQGYQDASRCYPDVGEWILMYRNYYGDPDFGGAAKCVKLSRIGEYKDFSAPIRLSFGQQGSMNGTLTFSSSRCYQAFNNITFTPNDDGGAVEVYHAIYINCESCFIVRHPYIANGYGCSLWRRSESLHKTDEGCNFIYDENCGTSPKYEIYKSTCEW